MLSDRYGSERQIPNGRVEVSFGLGLNTRWEKAFHGSGDSSGPVFVLPRVVLVGKCQLRYSVSQTLEYIFSWGLKRNESVTKTYQYCALKVHRQT